MANITVTSTTNTLQVDFGDYYPLAYQFQKGTWKKDHIQSIQLDSGVYISIDDERLWVVSYDGSNGFQIDSVDGVIPTSDLDLYNKLIALIV